MNRNGITVLTPGTYEIPVEVDLGEDVDVLDAGTVRTVIVRPDEE